MPSHHLVSGSPDRGKIPVIVFINFGGPIKMTENDQIGHCCFAYLVLPVMSCQFLGSLSRFLFLFCHFPCDVRSLVKSSRLPANSPASNLAIENVL